MSYSCLRQSHLCLGYLRRGSLPFRRDSGRPFLKTLTLTRREARYSLRIALSDMLPLGERSHARTETWGKSGVRTDASEIRAS
jgi:hypothetical protein